MKYGDIGCAIYRSGLNSNMKGEEIMVLCQVGKKIVLEAKLYRKYHSGDINCT